MIAWLIAVAVLVLIWGNLWKSQPKLAFGILLGLPIGWIISRPLAPYFTGMQDMPVWLPPLPFALVALLLFVLGGLTWFRSPKPESAEQSDDSEPTG